MINSSRNPYDFVTKVNKKAESRIKIRRVDIIPTFGKHIHALA